MAASKKHRFVVGIFEEVGALEDALMSLGAAALGEVPVAILASGKAVSTHLAPLSAASGHNLLSRLTGGLVPIRADHSGGAIYASRGALSDLLDSEATDEGLGLTGVLECWMLPRQAANLADFVVKGALLLWVEVVDASEEKSVSTLFLDLSDHQVHVHEFIDLP